MACVSKIGSLYEMVTKNVIVSTTNTVFGINPRAWIALPCEGLILLKIRQVVPTAGSALPVQIAVPARGGGRGRSRRSDGTYMGYGGGIYDHYGMHEKMKEMEERENELEERERRLEERERRHEMEDREYRRMGYESYPTDYYGDDRYYGDGPQMRRGRGRGRGRSY